MSRVDFTRPGVWQSLFADALTLVKHLEGVAETPVWSFGGGTVLMLRYGHRLSKDIDLFVPDPQYLGYVNPRLSEAAESVTPDYLESAECVKLFMPEGEIDVVVGTPLTDEPYEVLLHGERYIRVETSAEIIAKKMWHRGQFAKARDLFDLCAVAAFEPMSVSAAAPFMHRYGRAFLKRLQARNEYDRRQFEEIDALSFTPTFDECIETATRILEPILAERLNGALTGDTRPKGKKRKP